MIKKVEWKTSDGRLACVTVELITSEDINLDGDTVHVKKTSMEITATVNGQVVGNGKPKLISHQVAVASIGKLAMTKETLDLVNKAISSVEATPEWKSHLKAVDQARKVSQEYDAHRNSMRKIMGY